MKYSEVSREKREALAVYVYNEMVDSFDLTNNEFNEKKPMSFWTNWIQELMSGEVDITIDHADFGRMSRSLFDINFKDFKRFSVFKDTKPATYVIDINLRATTEPHAPTN